MLMTVYAFLGWLAVALLAWNFTKLSEQVDRLTQQQQSRPLELFCSRCDGLMGIQQSAAVKYRPNISARIPDPARSSRTP